VSEQVERPRIGHAGWSPVAETAIVLAAELLSGVEAYVVGGTVRDELLGRPIVDVDIAYAEPEQAARAFARASSGIPFSLSATHGGWRVALADGTTVDFTPLDGSIESDLSTRDFTINAIARPLAGGDYIDPFDGREDLDGRCLRAVRADIFEADPLRLLRAVRFEDELDFRLEQRTERLAREQARLVTKPAGERILEVLSKLSVRGWLRVDELGLLEHLGGSVELVDRAYAVDTPEYRLVIFLQDSLGLLPISRGLRRFAVALVRSQAPPASASPRDIHRFRRETEPWAIEALAFHGRLDLAPAVEEARVSEPEEPLVRGDELGLEPGPAIGSLLELIAEERAAGTISTREEALELARRSTTR
jgi:Poly A polymerase head domain